MSVATLIYEDATTGYACYVLLHHIVRLSKESADEDAITFIHLDTGEVLRTNDSMREINARINMAYNHRPANASFTDK